MFKKLSLDECLSYLDSKIFNRNRDRRRSNIVVDYDYLFAIQGHLNDYSMKLKKNEIG